jgi:metal-responsive CopG/Arc/MetJ family transcriptional regulator
MHPSIHVRIENELLRAIDEFRRREADPPTRPDAIRQLVQLGLMARQGGSQERSSNRVNK